MAQEVWNELTELHSDLKEKISSSEAIEQATGSYELDRSPSPEVTTAVSAERLRVLNDELLAVPDGFTVHPKLARQLERRRETLGADGGIDWAQAEALAFGSLLTEGTPIRLTGQDTERGTFSQRHLVLHDHQDRPGVLARSSACPARWRPWSCTTRRCPRWRALGFEYGYSQEAPETLVLWEAQFGDFVNGAQVIIDQFLVSGPGQVGADLASDAAAPAWLRGLGARALLARGWSASSSWRPRGTSAWPTRPRPRSTSTCCAARRASPSSAR